MADKKVRNQCIDFIKGIACIFVVFMHCEFPGYLGVFVQSISRFCVPLFFMISGYFCYRSGGVDYCRKIKHVWSIILGAIIFYLIVTPLYQSEFSIAPYSLIKWIIFNVPPYIAPQTWFLFALFYDYILFAFCEKLKLRNFAYLTIPIGICIYILLAQGAHLLGIHIPNLFYRNFLIEGFPLFVLGFWIHEHQDDINISNEVMVLSIVITTMLCPLERLIMGRDFGINIVSFLQVVAIFLFAIKKPDIGNRNLLSILGLNLSMYVYILHPAVMNILERLYKIIHIDEQVLALYLRPILCVTLSIAFAFFFYHLNKIVKRTREKIFS